MNFSLSPPTQPFGSRRYFCRDSIRFRSFEDDLINDRQWEQKEMLIADTGLTIFNQPIHSHLVELEKRLEDRITKVNQSISSGKMSIFKSKTGFTYPMDITLYS